jgi:hypothetical protein
MHLVQMLLPLYDNDGEPLPRELHAGVFRALTERFGGATAFTRSPAEGAWKEPGAGTTRDQVVIFEVMVQALERDWWAAYRRRLEVDFKQEKILIRATQVEEL